MRRIPTDPTYQLPPYPGYPYFPPEEEKEVHLRDYWRVIRKRLWIVLAVFLITMVVTAIHTFTQRPVYRGTATIQINIENPQIVDFKEIFTVNMWAQDYYQTQYRILESRSLAKRVVRKLKLWEHAEFVPRPPSSFQKWKGEIRSAIGDVLRSMNILPPRKADPMGDLGLGQEDPEDEKEAPYISLLLGGLKIEPVKESRLARLHFDSHSPDLAGKVPNILAAEYILMNLESRVHTTEEAKKWLASQLDDLKAKVEKADEALQEFGSKNDIISLDDKENITVQRLNDLNEALAKAESERMAKEAIYRQVRQNKGRAFEALPSILENKLIQDLKQSYIQLEAQYMKLSETFKPNYPEMVKLKNQMETTERRLNLEVDKIIASIKNEYESSLRKEALLRTAFEEQKTKAMEMQQKSIRYNILKREADTNRDLYKSLLQRMKEVGVSAGFNASNVQVVDRAEIPQGPYKPDRRRSLLLAAVIGLFLGIGLTFFFEYLDNTVKTPEDIEQQIRLPSFGMVPEVSCERRSKLPRGRLHPVELIASNQPRSILSEAYRNIRTSLLLSFSEQPPRKIVVTSANPLEGKTTTLINTAISLSQTGARVLIVDADMRRPRVHKVFDRKNGAGLSNFLSGNTKLWTVIHRSNIDNLYYIPAGPVPPNPAELIGSNLFRDMVQALAERFDHVLIDAPPLAGFADSVILSTMVDGVILVVSSGKTPRMSLQRAKEALHQVHAKILGVVINRVNIHHHEYSDYYRYNDYYTQRQEKKELPYKSNRGQYRPRTVAR